MWTFRFSSKKILQFLVPQKIFIFIFDPSFKVNSYFWIKFFKKNHNIIRISKKKKVKYVFGLYKYVNFSF